VIDALTVARKELRELLGERASRRGLQVQAVVIVAFLGIFIPAKLAGAWLAASPAAIVLYLIMPSLVAGSFGADAFAGERERRTLETLLATPLADHAIVAGKAIAALAAALAVAVIAMVAGSVTINVVAAPPAVFVPPPELWLGALLGTLASSCVSTAVAIALSIRIAVARSVQQMVSLMFVLPVFLGGVIWSSLGLAFTWHNILVLEALAFALGIAGLALASARFRRDRLFVRR